MKINASAQSRSGLDTWDASSTYKGHQEKVVSFENNFTVVRPEKDNNLLNTSGYKNKYNFKHQGTYVEKCFENGSAVELGPSFGHGSEVLAGRT